MQALERERGLAVLPRQGQSRSIELAKAAGIAVKKWFAAQCEKLRRQLDAQAQAITAGSAPALEPSGVVALRALKTLLECAAHIRTQQRHDKNKFYALHAIGCATGDNIRWMMRAIVAQAAKAAKAAKAVFGLVKPNAGCDAGYSFGRMNPERCPRHATHPCRHRPLPTSALLTPFFQSYLCNQRLSRAGHYVFCLALVAPGVPGVPGVLGERLALSPDRCWGTARGSGPRPCRCARPRE